MVGVHICVYLEHETAERFFLRLYLALYSLYRTGDGAICTKQSSSSLTPNVFSAEPKNTGANFGQVFPDSQIRDIRFDKFQVFPELSGIHFANGFIDTRVVYVLDFHTFCNLCLIRVKRSNECS